MFFFEFSLFCNYRSSSAEKWMADEIEDWKIDEDGSADE